MKQVCLVRHAKAVGKNIGIPDFERQLESSGRDDAIDMARYAMEIGITPGILVSSPAARALQTAEAFADVYSVDTGDIVRDDRLYYQRAESFVDIIRETADSADSITLFGHNPTLSECASHLASKFDRDMPKAGVVVLEFDVDSWSDLMPGNGKLIHFIRPADVCRDNERKNEAELSERIADAIMSVLTGVDPQAAPEMEEQVAKSAEKLARKFRKSKAD